MPDTYTPGVRFFDSPLSAIMQWNALTRNLLYLYGMTTMPKVTSVNSNSGIGGGLPLNGTLTIPNFQPAAGSWYYANILCGDTLHIDISSGGSHSVYLDVYPRDILGIPTLGTRYGLVNASTSGSNVLDVNLRGAPYNMPISTPYRVYVLNSFIHDLHEFDSTLSYTTPTGTWTEGSNPSLSDWNSLGVASDQLFARTRYAHSLIMEKINLNLTHGFPLFTNAVYTRPALSWTVPDLIPADTPVEGDNGAAQAKKFFDALGVISGSLQFFSPLTIGDTPDNVFYGMRCWDTLWYLPNAGGNTPKIFWWAPDQINGPTTRIKQLNSWVTDDGREAVTDLGLSRKWKRLDLNSIEMLLPGMPYAIMGSLMFAIESPFNT